MNFKQIKTKIILENFVKYCKKNEITDKDLNNLNILFNEKNYLNEAIGDWLMGKAQDVMKFGAGKLYQMKLNSILKKVQPVLNQLSTTTTEVDDLIKKYNISNDKIATDVLNTLKDLKQPFDQFQKKVQNLSATSATGVKTTDDTEETPEGVNAPLIEKYVGIMEKTFDANSSPYPTPESEQNKKLFMAAIKKYFYKLDPTELEKAKNLITKQLQATKGNDAKIYAVITNISRTTGSPLPTKTTKIKGVTDALAEKWKNSLKNRLFPIDPMTGLPKFNIDTNVLNDFLNTYKKFLMKIDATQIQTASDIVTKALEKFVAPKLPDETKEKGLLQITARLKQDPSSWGL